METNTTIAEMKETQSIVSVVNIMIEDVQNKVARMREHNISPRFVRMSPHAYLSMRDSLLASGVYAISEDAIMGLPIVICDCTEGIDVVPSAADMLNYGLL